MVIAMLEFKKKEWTKTISVHAKINKLFIAYDIFTNLWNKRLNSDKRFFSEDILYTLNTQADHTARMDSMQNELKNTQGKRHHCLSLLSYTSSGR